MPPDNPKAADFRRRYGPTALVAGASEGIGRAFALELAGAGMHLILVARRAGPLAALSAELRAVFSIEVTTVACDLADDRAGDEIEEACRDREVGLLVYNAAASSVGPFLATPLAEHLRTIAVNAKGPVLLIHRLAGAMRERRRGGVVIMSSLTAFQGTPLVSLYGATKAFDLVFAEGLGRELAEHGVDVLACCAGATLTPGYERVTPRRALSRFAPKPQDPREVACEALAALGRQPVVVTGKGNRIASFVMRRLMTRRRAVLTIHSAMKARYDPAP